MIKKNENSVLNQLFIGFPQILIQPLISETFYISSKYQGSEKSIKIEVFFWITWKIREKQPQRVALLPNSAYESMNAGNTFDICLSSNHMNR